MQRQEVTWKEFMILKQDALTQNAFLMDEALKSISKEESSRENVE